MTSPAAAFILADMHPQRLKLTIPLTHKASLAVVGIGNESFVLLVETQYIWWAGVDADAATGARDLVHLNAGHSFFPFGETRGAYVAWGGPGRCETIQATARPIA